MLRKTSIFLDLWRAIGRGKLPRRDQFNPRNFPTLLPHLFVADVGEGLENYTVQLAGRPLHPRHHQGL